jgi:hypothetical protein
MNTMTKNILMLVAAGYIIYTGIMTIRGTLAGEVSSNMTFMVIGTVFVAFGVAAFIFYGKAFLKEMKENNVVVEEEDDLEIEDTKEDAEGTDS